MKIIPILTISSSLLFSSASLLAFDNNMLPSEASASIMEHDDVYIVDVRTDAEWRWVGHPASNKMEEGTHLDGKVVNISYKIFQKDAFIINPSFVSDINELFPNKETVTLITMCRSGKRSVAAAEALMADGYNVYNMLTGFEGGSDDYGYRTLSGWKNDGLPYKISGTGEYDD